MRQAVTAVPMDAARGTRSDASRVVLFVGAHVLLALLMYQVPSVATLHAAVTITAGTFLAMSGRVDRAVYASAYIAGSEVLWRMREAAIFWESGKYAVLLIFLIALVRLRPVRAPALPVLYFLFLIPSIAVAPYDLLSDLARQQISFNLSGPAALAVSVCFLSQIQLGRREWLNTVIALAGPLAAIVTVAVYNTITVQTLNFTLNSNDVTSGGFGPNQVSAVLGLGALLTFLTGIEPWRSTLFKWTMLGIALVLATQSAMTFSRGGLYGVAGALIAGSWYLLRDRRARLPLGLTAIAFGAMVTLVILPQLDRLTHGMLVARFEMVSTTGRDKFARLDLDAFLTHPVSGLGPGGGAVSEARPGAAHTELTRLLAEHGLLGAGAVTLLFVMAFRALQGARAMRDKALVAALLAWSLLTMSHMAMRIVAPSLVFGLAFAIRATGAGTSRAWQWTAR